MCACTHTLPHSVRAYLQYEREARQSGVAGGSSQSSHVWDRGPDVLRGFSQGMGWNGTIIKRAGGRQPRGSSAFTHSRRENILRAPLHSPHPAPLPLCDSCAHKNRAINKKQLLWQLQFTIYALKKEIKLMSHLTHGAYLNIWMLQT